LTGAGLSTACGLPDFRSDNFGFWKQNKPVHFNDFISSKESRLKSWSNNVAIRASIKNKRPTKMHGFINQVLKKNKNNTHITQNIDGLHNDPSLSAQIVELHGSVFGAACLSCGKSYDPAVFFTDIVKKTEDAMCTECNEGYVKTSTISFGQNLETDSTEKASLASKRCDLFICLGSSLQVSPANNFPQNAKKNNAKLIIINRDPTPLDVIADLVIYDELEKIYEKIT